MSFAVRSISRLRAVTSPIVTPKLSTFRAPMPTSTVVPSSPLPSLCGAFHSPRLPGRHALRGTPQPAVMQTTQMPVVLRTSSQRSRWWETPRSSARVGMLPFLASGLFLATAAATAANDDDKDASGDAFIVEPDEIVTDGEGRQVPARFVDMKVFSGTANVPLAQEIVNRLNMPLGKISIKCFADGEIGIRVEENVRGKDVYLIQPTSPPGVNDHLMELILLVSTMRRASARTITAVIPYYGYARQDRKMASRVPISAADVARLLESMGVDRVVAVDLHCGQIQGFFSPHTPCDNLEGASTALPYFAQMGLDPKKTVVVSPDAGGVHRAKQFRDGLNRRGLDAGLAMIIKQRLRAGMIESMDLVGSVDDCDVIIVDDMIDTAGTLCKAAKELKNKGAKKVYAFATHGLFSGPAIERIGNSVLEKVVVCNTIKVSAEKQIPRIETLSIAPLLAAAITSIHTNKSVSSLFK